jgi:hypothetical protein
MTRLRRTLLILLVLALGGAGYFVFRYLHRVHPEPPPRGASRHTAPALESESSIRVPIAVDIAMIASIADQRLPQELLARKGIDAGGGVAADVVVRRAGRLTAEAQDGKVHLRVPVEADIAAILPAQGLVGLMSRGRRSVIKTRAAFTIRAEIGLGVDDEWNLATSTAATLVWEEDPVVQVGPLSVKLSALIGDRIGEKFAAVVRTFDERLRDRIPTRSMVSRAWTAGFRSLAVGKRDDLWLALRPTGVFLGEPRIRDSRVTLEAGIRGVFRVVVGAPPEAAAPTPLPVRSAPPLGPGIALDVPVSVSFEAANRQLDQSLEGHTFDAPLDIVGESIALTIETVEVYPSGEQIAVALEFSAGLRSSWFDVEGQLYLLGTPVLDVPGSRLRVSGLAFDSRTDRALVNVAAWMLHDEIVRRVEGLLVFGFAERLGDYRDQINAAIAHYRVSDSVRLHGKIRDATVVALTVTDPAIVAVVQLRGDARLAVAPSR